jgi:hypothetical protein
VYAKTCEGCGNEFHTESFRQKRCRKDCSRTNSRQLEFIGVDGEGVDRPDGRHEYVMLSVGDRTLFRDGRMLGTSEIFAFLYKAFQANPRAAYVGFFLGYDFIQWERNLPESVAWSLLTKEGIAKRKSLVQGGSPYPDPVVWEGWEFDVLAGRRWKLRPHEHTRSKWSGECRNRTCGQLMGDPDESDPRDVRADGVVPDPSQVTLVDSEGPDFWSTFTVPGMPTEMRRKSAPWMYICDTGPFWQQAFLKVIDPKNWPGEPVCTKDEYETVVKGKADRGTVAAYGDVSYADEMARYNVLENAILARVTSRLDAGFRNEHIPIRIGVKDWYGPGRAAQLWMDQLSALTQDPEAVAWNKEMRPPASQRRNEYTLRNADVYRDMPEWAQVAAQATYYGGWFEQMVHGHVGDVWEYDINSAYPAVIATLPCLHTTGTHTGTWSQGTGPIPDDGLTIVHARVVGSDPHIGAMPFRDLHGNIYRPNRVEGTYWWHEIQAGMRAGVIDTVDVIEWTHLRPCGCPPPFNDPAIGIERMYNLRLQVGKNTPQGKGFKLVYNSAYGKTAQSIGSPKYSNPLYASLITAGCRTQILDAIASHPGRSRAVCMVATDGIYFTSPHPGLDMDAARLGAWDEQRKTNLTQLMPGVYWDDATRNRIRTGGAPHLKSRGVNARDLARAIEGLDSQFDDLLTSVHFKREPEWPQLTFGVGFLLDSALVSLRRGKWNQAGRVQHGTQRSIDSNPKSKRDVATTYRDGSWIRTRPYERAPHESVGYDKSFGYAEYILSQQEDGQIGMDGRSELAWFKDLLLDN